MKSKKKAGKKKARSKAGKKVGKKSSKKVAKKSAKKAGKQVAKKSAKKSTPAVKRTAASSRPPGVPEGHHSVTAYLTVRGGAAALDFYQRAFGAKVLGRLPMPDGKLGHAEFQIGDSRIMLADEAPEWGNKGPEMLGGTPVGLCIYLKGVDAAFTRAVAAGAKVVRPPADQFYGDRMGVLLDPFGHQWTVAERKENLSFAQMAERMAKLPPS